MSCNEALGSLLEDEKGRTYGEGNAVGGMTQEGGGPGQSPAQRHHMCDTPATVKLAADIKHVIGTGKPYRKPRQNSDI